MTKIILTLISIFLLNAGTSWGSENSDPPPLPTSSITTTESEGSNNSDESFWNKILNFIGLGEKKQSAQNQEQQDKQKPIEQTEDQNQKSSSGDQTIPAIPAIRPPIQEANILGDSKLDLKLPEGFDDVNDQQNTNEQDSKEQHVTQNTSQNTPLTSDQNKTEDKVIITEDIPATQQQDTTTAESFSDLNKAPEKSPLTEDIIKIQIESAKDSPISKYRQQLRQRLNQPANLPQIPENEVNTSSKPKQNTENVTDPKQLKFIADEAQVLTLPNDDVVLGNITHEAYLDLVDFSTYVPIFWENYNIVKNEPARIAINNFIKNYDDNFPKYSQHELTIVLGNAFDAIDNHFIYKLKNLIDNYPILQLTDQNGNTLLHKAVSNDNYPAARLLLMKGIDISSKNDNALTAMDIAIRKNNHRIINLLEAANKQ